VVGIRPIDLHLKGLESLNCVVEVENGVVKVNAHQARGDSVFMGGPMGSTVTGTANIIMAATLTPEPKIESAALEPEITDLCLFLNKMGAKINGYGAPIITIEGVDELHGCEHTIISDRIETGTLLVQLLLLAEI
jgi:UDP-N-acetylglucosamine 1-carboxyvinyltransferase